MLAFNAVLAKALSVPFVERTLSLPIATTVAEGAPTPTLPRKREMEQTVSVEKKQP